MPDLKEVMNRYSCIFDILSSDDGIHLVFLDSTENIRELHSELASYLKIKSYFRLSDFPLRAKHLLDCHSARHGKTLHQVFGLERQFIITYGLESLGHSNKTLFGYALKGRGNDSGLLGEVNGSTIGRNSIILPEKGIEKIKEFMDYWKVTYATKQIFVDIQQKKVKR
ncbi:hypothetical protein JXA85_01655 [Candidatus Woesearchaeota archaeon]|nr:hypothetical protein [Candidatus Woesearchaeota archaeon]